MNPSIVIGATLAPFAMSDPGVWGSWLRNPQPHKYFAALEVDKRGRGVYQDMIEYNYEPLTHWTYHYGDGREQVTSANRGRHIAMGRNMIFDFAIEYRADYVLMMDADVILQDDTIPKLLEVVEETSVNVVGAYCPAFAMDGVREIDFPGDTRIHLATGCTLISSHVFTKLRYGPMDDWGFQADCLRFLNEYQYVRRDAVVPHFPDAIPPLEDRGYDLRMHQ